MDISVYITSDLTSSERRISPQWDLAFLKQKLELTTGIEPKFQTLHYYPRQSDNHFVVLSESSQYNLEKDQNTKVSLLNIVPYARIHVHDANEASITAQLALQDEEAAAFQYSEEEYAKRGDSVLAWKQNQKLGRFDPEFQLIKSRNAAENEAISENIAVGDRCRNISIQGERRGVVKFVGKLPQLDQGELIWVGVEFDEPVGKNSGQIDGVRIFECRENHGSFLKPKQIDVGDYPEIDPFASDDEL